MATTTIECPNCSLRLRVPEERLGSRLACPRCQTAIVSDTPSDDFDVIEDDDDERPERPARDPDRPRKKKRKKKKSRASSQLKWMIAGTVAGGLVVVGLLVWLLIYAFTPEPIGPPPDDWKTFESPNRVRVKMPGEALRTVQHAPGGVQIVMNSVSPDQNSVYAVGWSEGEIPAARRALPTEKLLDDACAGSLANTPGATESSRKSIQLGPYPGKMLVMRVPQGGGRMIVCGYLNEKTGRFYMALVGGKGFNENSKQVRWFLESFEILETDAPPPPPKEQPKEKSVPSGKKDAPAKK